MKPEYTPLNSPDLRRIHSFDWYMFSRNFFVWCISAAIASIPIFWVALKKIYIDKTPGSLLSEMLSNPDIIYMCVALTAVCFAELAWLDRTAFPEQLKTAINLCISFLIIIVIFGAMGYGMFKSDETHNLAVAIVRWYFPIVVIINLLSYIFISIKKRGA